MVESPGLVHLTGHVRPLELKVTVGSPHLRPDAALKSDSKLFNRLQLVSFGLHTQGVSMFGIGTTELLIVGFIVLILFGSRLPGVMRSLGQGVVEFKKGVQGIEDEKESSEKR